MAIELQVTSVTALVTSEPRERQIYDGRGDDRRVKGRFLDGAGRPVSVVSAVVVAEPVGLLPDAQVQLPDIQMSGLVPGCGGADRGHHHGAADRRRLRGHPGHGHR